MAANNIVYDEDSVRDRFASGMNVSFVETTDKTLSNTNLYYETVLKCCSPVKSTKNNWFYLLNNKLAETERFRNWIADVIPMFPELDIKVIKSEARIVKQTDSEVTGNNNFLDLKQKDASGNYIRVILGLSTLSTMYYGFTNTNNYSSMYFDSLVFMANSFINSCIDTKIPVTAENYKEVIIKYVSDNIEQIRNEFRGPYPCYASPTKTGCGSRSNVHTAFLIDFSSINIDNMTEYLTECVNCNITTISRFISKKSAEPETAKKYSLYIQALYSKKAYTVQAYLAHHLIRAGISDQFKAFIDQYFKIKKELPKEYFWNLIFLTQFGFKFYYYYWLTNARQFRLTSKEEFERTATYHSDTSSLALFAKFSVSQTGITFNHLKKLYLDGDFKNVVMLLRSSVKIQVKASKRERLTNLRIANYYDVLSMDENYFTIRGDDFRMHRYLKSNFIVIQKTT